MAALGKRFKPEQIVNLLREIEVMMVNGKSFTLGFQASRYM